MGGVAGSLKRYKPLRLFVCGGAGTGKSRLLRAFVSRRQKRAIEVLRMTEMAGAGTLRPAGAVTIIGTGPTVSAGDAKCR